MFAIISIILLLVVFLLYYKWFTQNYDYFHKKGIKYIKPDIRKYWPFRSIGITDLLVNAYNEYPEEKIFGSFQLRRPVYFLKCPNIIKKIAIKDFAHFQDHSEIFKTLDDMFSSVLIAMNGKKWREMRLALTPAFTGSKMRLMLQFINKCCEDFVEFVKDELKDSSEKSFPIKEVLAKYTNDVIATCAFGVECNSFEDPNNEILLIGKEFGDLQKPSKAFKLGLNFFFPKLAKFLGIQAFHEEAKTKFRKIILETMETREKHGIVRPDMINILIELRRFESLNKENTKSWTETELVAQSFQFFLAGYESSSHLMSFMAYELAINPDVQNKLIEEIDELNERLEIDPLTYESLNGMKYLNMVVLEVLRKWPPAVATDRLCVENYTYDDEDGNNFTIEKGMLLNIPIYALHMDPTFFPKPEQFNPERFSEESSTNMDAFLPFGIGPRNCIGFRFALMEIKALFYYILRNFKIVPSKETQVPLQLRKTILGIFPDKPIMLCFVSRKVDQGN